MAVVAAYRDRLALDGDNHGNSRNGFSFGIALVAKTFFIKFSIETFIYSTERLYSNTERLYSKMITEKQGKVLKFLATGSYSENYINNIARECNLAVSGSQWILNNLEEQDIIIHQDIGNLKSYNINFNDKSKDFLSIAYSEKLNDKLENRRRELEPLEKVSKISIVFGSYLHKKDPNDIDILFILDKNSDYDNFNEKLGHLRHIVPVKVHAVLQTRKDLIGNIKKKDKIIIEALRNGILLWGNKYLVEVFEDVSKR